MHDEIKLLMCVKMCVCLQHNTQHHVLLNSVILVLCQKLIVCQKGIYSVYRCFFKICKVYTYIGKYTLTNRI